MNHGELVSTYIAIFILGIFVCSGLFTIMITLPLYEVDNGSAIASWKAKMLFGGYVLSAIMPVYFGYLYDINGAYQNIVWGLFICGILLLLCFYLFIKSKASSY